MGIVSRVTSLLCPTPLLFYKIKAAGMCLKLQQLKTYRVTLASCILVPFFVFFSRLLFANSKVGYVSGRFSFIKRGGRVSDAGLIPRVHAVHLKLFLIFLDHFHFHISRRV